MRSCLGLHSTHTWGGGGEAQLSTAGGLDVAGRGDRDAEDELAAAGAASLAADRSAPVRLRMRNSSWSLEQVATSSGVSRPSAT